MSIRSRFCRKGDVEPSPESVELLESDFEGLGIDQKDIERLFAEHTQERIQAIHKLARAFDPHLTHSYPEDLKEMFAEGRPMYHPIEPIDKSVMDVAFGPEQELKKVEKALSPYAISYGSWLAV